MASPAPDQPLQDETYLSDQDAAEIIDFLAALRDRGRQAAGPRPRLTGSDGRSVEPPEPMFEVLVQVAATMKAGLAVTVAQHHLLTAWLAERGILEANPTNCLLGGGLGHAPGPRAWDVVTEQYRPWGGGVRVVTGRTVFDTDIPLSAECPNCAESVILTNQKTWDIMPEWDTFDYAVDAWLEGGSGTVLCPECQRPVPFNDWRWPNGGGWGLGFLGLEFWDWPELSRGLLWEVSQFLEHRVLLNWGSISRVRSGQPPSRVTVSIPWPCGSTTDERRFSAS